MTILNQISCQVAENVFKTNFKEVADFVANQPNASTVCDVAITFIICATIAVCIMFVANATKYSLRQSYETRLKEQKSRQEYEKAKLIIEKAGKGHEPQILSMIGCHHAQTTHDTDNQESQPNETT